MQNLSQSPDKNKESDILLSNPNHQNKVNNQEDQIVSDSECNFLKIEQAHNCDTIESIENKINNNINLIDKFKEKKQKLRDEFENSITQTYDKDKQKEYKNDIEKVRQEIKKLKDQNIQYKKILEEKTKNIALENALDQIKLAKQQQKNERLKQYMIDSQMPNETQFTTKQLEKVVEAFYNENKLYLKSNKIIPNVPVILLSFCKRYLGLTLRDELPSDSARYICYYYYNKTTKQNLIWSCIDEYNILVRKKDFARPKHKDVFNALNTFYNGRQILDNQINDIRFLNIIKKQSIWSIMCVSCSHNMRQKRDAAIAFERAINQAIEDLKEKKPKLSSNTSSQYSKDTITSNANFASDARDSLFQGDQSLRTKSLTEVCDTKYKTDDIQLLLSDQQPNITKLIDTAIVTCKSQSDILDQKTDKKEVSENGKEALFAFCEVYQKDYQHVGSPQKPSTFLEIHQRQQEEKIERKIKEFTL